MSIKNRPNKKLGSEMPAKDKTVTPWSMPVPLFFAASIPIGIAITLAMMSAYSAREMVGFTWLNTTLATGSPPAVLIPKSPWNIFPIQMKYCSTNGRFRPIFSSSFAISSAVAKSPSRVAAGLPGTIFSSVKMTTDTTNRTGITDSSLLTMNFCISFPPTTKRI